MTYLSSESNKRNGPVRFGLSWLLAGAFLLGSATTGGAFAAGVIRSADIVDGQVKRVDLADDAVNGAKVQNGTIRTNDLAPSPWVYVSRALPYPDACGAGGLATFCGATMNDFPVWGNYGEGWQPARFRTDVTGVVELEGVIAGQPGAAFVLPPAYRPQHGHAFAASCASKDPDTEHTAGRMSVYPDGRVVWEGADGCAGSNYVSLSGIRFDTE